MVKCRHCDKECKNARSESIHQLYCKKNPGRRDISGKKHPNYGKKLKRRKGKRRSPTDEPLHCAHCQKVCTSDTSKLQHEKYCDKNPERIKHHMLDVWKLRDRGEIKKPSFKTPEAKEAWKENIKKGIHSFWESPESEKTRKILSEKSRSFRHSEETKKLLSRKQTEYLKNNPDKHPYVLYHSSKTSPAEEYWRECLTNEGILSEEQYQVGLWVLDFAWPEQKINLEIDGDWHYNDGTCVEKDKRRDKELQESGWRVIRVRWSSFRALPREGREKEVKRIAGEIRNAIQGV